MGSEPSSFLLAGLGIWVSGGFDSFFFFFLLYPCNCNLGSSHGGFLSIPSPSSRYRGSLLQWSHHCSSLSWCLLAVFLVILLRSNLSFFPFSHCSLQIKALAKIHAFVQDTWVLPTFHNSPISREDHFVLLLPLSSFI